MLKNPIGIPQSCAYLYTVDLTMTQCLLSASFSHKHKCQHVLGNTGQSGQSVELAGG